MEKLLQKLQLDHVPKIVSQVLRYWNLDYRVLLSTVRVGARVR